MLCGDDQCNGVRATWRGGCVCVVWGEGAIGRAAALRTARRVAPALGRRASRPPPGGYDEGGSDAEEEGAVVLATRRRMRGGGATAECPFCGRECATERLGKHIETCIQGRVMSALRSVVLPGATSGVVHASPVRNVAVVVKTPSRLSLAWALPLVLGSHPIRDFEVRLSKRTSKRYGKTVAHTYEEHVVSTSRWCFSLPVAAKGAIIEGLLASTDYDRIAVRAVSEVGAGAWSEMIECVTTPGSCACARDTSPALPMPQGAAGLTVLVQGRSLPRVRSSSGACRPRHPPSRSPGASRCATAAHLSRATRYSTRPRCMRRRAARAATATLPPTPVNSRTTRADAAHSPGRGPRGDYWHGAGGDGD